MYARLVPQHDFFIYVPLVQKQEKNQADNARKRCKEQPSGKLGEPVLTNWTRVALPGHLTVYTHACGDEER